MRYLVTLISISLLFSCSKGSESISVGEESSSDLTTTSSGLQYNIYQLGTGPKVENGKQITTHCILTLQDGTKIWSTRDDDQPYVFVQGVTSHIAGFEEGLSYMKEGDRAHIVIPSRLGYGANGMGPIPGNADLIYDIEVLKVANQPDL